MTISFSHSLDPERTSRTANYRIAKGSFSLDVGRPLPASLAGGAATAEALQLKAIALVMLRDCDYGLWTGRSFDDVCASDPEGVAAWLRDPAATPHGGESLLRLMQRVAEWLEGENLVNHQAIVVTHATIVRAAIVHAIDATPKSFWRIDTAKDRWNFTSAGGTMP